MSPEAKISSVRQFSQLQNYIYQLGGRARSKIVSDGTDFSFLTAFIDGDREPFMVRYDSRSKKRILSCSEKQAQALENAGIVKFPKPQRKK